jgi:hypothetical protein
MWELKWTDQCKEWISYLDDNTKEDILAHLLVLEEKGPALGRPYADTIAGSKIKNLKELRVQSNRKVIRIFFVFTKTRVGLLLAGDDKRGNKRFYEKMIPTVEKIYSDWLESESEE